VPRGPRQRSGTRRVRAAWVRGRDRSGQSARALLATVSGEYATRGADLKADDGVSTLVYSAMHRISPGVRRHESDCRSRRWGISAHKWELMLSPATTSLMSFSAPRR
jgi:hypothetical protein